MIEHRPFAALGRADHGWLKARHHFSFAGYHDPSRMGWGALRVLNDDEIAPGRGFPSHAHRDMEIVTYVQQGAITHKDSLGNEGRTAAGDVQVLSAGTGVSHSEYNLEPETTRLFQLWIHPREVGLAPRWATKPFARDGKSGFVVLASGFADDPNALPIAADARVLGARLGPDETATYELTVSRHAYLVAVRGAVQIGDLVLGERDAAAITDEATIEVRARAAADLILIDAA